MEGMVFEFTAAVKEANPEIHDILKWTESETDR